MESVLFPAPPQEWDEGAKGTVVLIPGWAETWVFLRTIASQLNHLGYKVLVIRSLGRNLNSVQNAAEKAKAFIDARHLNNVILLSHSKGGIIAKLLLDDPTFSNKIKRSISIAVPYQGTIFGYFYFFSLHQLAPKSQIISAVNNTHRENAKIINIYPKFDNTIIPNQNLLLNRAKNICIDCNGHTRVLEAKATLTAITKYLKED